MRIDCQTHIFPAVYAEVLARNPQSPQADLQDDGCIITYGDLQAFNLKYETYSLNKKIRDMDAAGIDISLLSVNMPGPESLVPELGVEGARVSNDALAEAAQKHPDRLLGLASLPWQDVPSALAEMDRAIGQLGFRGIMLYAHTSGEPIDSTVYDPIYNRAAELDVPVVLHPTVPPWGEPLKEYSMIPMVGLMVHQSFAMLRLILGGVLERHPKLKIVQPHCGGILPYLWGRVENQTEIMGRGRDNITRPVGDYYHSVYFDIVSPSPLALRYIYDFASPDRLLFATDHPWVDMNLLINLVTEMDIPEGDKDRIFGTNAQTLFKID
ncbi:MAG: amidohydrolase family protein [bacterium]|nr:amidohydrolase family protein [bacterium]